MPAPKIIVAYESLFGNTRTIGEAIAEGLRGAGELVVGSVDEIPPETAEGVALIVAGGPTHAHGMVSKMTRQGAEKDVPKYGPLLPGVTLLRDWIAALPPGTAPVAAFDTRFNKPAWITGAASKGIAKRLVRKGYRPVATESFLVSGSTGPLVDGERERAIALGRTLAATITEKIAS